MISVFDMFSIGIGPSSSHTVGPMKAAVQFVEQLNQANQLKEVASIQTQLFGSLGQTGIGHGSGKAVILGLMGLSPETVDTQSIDKMLEEIEQTELLPTLGGHKLSFPRQNAIVFHRRKSMPLHANGLSFEAFDQNQNRIAFQEYYSIGGGFVVTAEEFGQVKEEAEQAATIEVPFPFQNASELVNHCKDNGISISTLMLKNELVHTSEEDLKAYLLSIWKTMDDCIENGIKNEGILPGGLKLARRANKLYRRLSIENNNDPLNTLDWVNLFALAVNEENAAGGRVVTAPTNGAAGIIPAVLKYVDKFVRPSGRRQHHPIPVNCRRNWHSV